MGYANSNWGLYFICYMGHNVIWGTRMNKTISLSLACQTATELKCELWPSCSTCLGQVETELEKMVISYILKVLCLSTIIHSNRTSQVL